MTLGYIAYDITYYGMTGLVWLAQGYILWRAYQEIKKESSEHEEYDENKLRKL